jgi:3-methyladenine DNA glycosylase AlkC
LKTLLPPIVEAYLESLLKPTTRPNERHIDVQTALASILYTLCKVRGAKVIVGFLNNEPRYLEPILATLENVTLAENADVVDWKVPYILLLWLSHLLLTPFDLASISANSLPQGSEPIRLQIHDALPPVAQRIVYLGTSYLSASTKAQDAAAAMLVRLATRPDMQKLQVADALLTYAVSEISSPAESSTTIYRQLGPLRFLAGIATSADICHLMPVIYRTCARLGEDDGLSPVTSNAVGKKLIVKIYRNIAILTLRLPSASGAVLSFLETTSVLEEVIDHLLQSLGDRDTPVRYAAAKAISLIISELEPEMGHEVIQAVLDTFKEDIPRSTKGIDYQTVNALKWHGLTLTLSHALFKRSASPSQLPDILNALVSALNFEQRTATGSSMGTNVRDAANFGIWSLSRRYTSDELLSVDTSVIRLTSSTSKQTTVIQAMAVQLLLSACLDPAGNIRRGSSAALQELIGRHPNQVIEGISVVQIVDYQAVGLRKRGLIDVAGKAASLDYTYWEALVDGLIAWRGLRSVDVPAREAAALSLANLVSIRDREDGMAIVVERLLASLEDSSSSDIETMHGLVCSLSYLLDLPIDAAASETHNTLHRRFWLAVQSRGVSRVDYNPRSLKSELPVAMAKLVTSVCRVEAGNLEKKENTQDSTVFEDMEDFVHRLLTRHEDPILQVIPNMAKQLVGLQKHSSKSMECISVESLSRAVAADGSKAVLGGSGRAIALGTVALQHDDGPRSDATNFAISTIANLVTARNVDWRIVGLRALHLVLENLDASVKHDLQNMAVIVQAIHAGLTDYTIDERGDIGSLVRLQGLTCVSRLLSTALLTENTEYSELLKSDVLRLSLEKLDRVRARAAECKQTRLPAYFSVEESSNINSQAYLSSALSPIFKPNCPPWALRALIEGAISCAGISAESLLQTSRQILTTSLHSAEIQHVQTLFTVYSEVLRDSVASTTQKASVLVLPALDLLAFFLDMRVLQRLADPETASFKWRSMLSSVQKSHHKSSDVMKLLAAVNVYRGLAEVESIRGEVVKKLLSMLATNPYPRIRVAVAEVLFEVLGAEEMKGVNWTEKGGAVQMEMVAEFKKKFVEGV